MSPLRRLVPVLAVCASLLVIVPGAGAAPAADGPGALSHFDLARKDCVGTARNDSSKVWFTVADGVLSDVYFPTIDNTNVETLQYIVTDGATYTDLQTRDMTSRRRHRRPRADLPGDEHGQQQALSHRHRLHGRPRSRHDPRTARASTRCAASFGLRLYVRHDPTLNGNGGGGADNAGKDDGAVAHAGGHDVLVGQDLVTATNAANRDYGVPVHSALDVTGGFDQVTNGFAGAASDGLTQIDTSHALTDATRAPPAATSSRWAASPSGATAPSRLRSATARPRRGLSPPHGRRSTRATNGSRGRTRVRGTGTTESRRAAPPARRVGADWAPRIDAWYLQANVVKASEDKTFPGAFAAGLGSPWGRPFGRRPARTYFGSYRETFARDLYETFTALMAAGDRASARAAVRFLFDRQQLPDGSMPRNSLPNGKPAPDTFNTQLDECAYPIVMALAAGMTVGALYEDHIRPAANFVAAHGPSFGPERWEEQSGFSPSTIAAEIAGLLAAADIAVIWTSLPTVNRKFSAVANTR